MSPNPTSGEEVLVCPSCGRVNQVIELSTRSSSIRCSGCGTLLRAERSRHKGVVNCPACAIAQVVDLAWAGRHISCGSCGTPFVLRFSGKSTGAPAAAVLPSASDPPPDDPADGTLRGKVHRTRKKKKKRNFNTLKKALKLPLLTALVFSGIIWFIKRSWPTPEAPAVAPAVVVPEVLPPAAPADVAPTPLSREESEQVSRTLKEFVSAPSNEEMMGVVRFPGQVGQRMRGYYERIAPAQLKVTGIEASRLAAVNGRLFLVIDLKLADNKRVPIVFERTSPGHFLVDWDSFVRYASTDWNLFVARRPPDETQDFQLFVKRGDIGNAHFPLEEFNSFVVFWKEESDGVPLFVRRGSLEELALLEATDHKRATPAQEPASPPPGVAPMTLEVFFRAGANSDGQPAALELKSIVHDGWVDVRPGNG